MLKKLLPLCLLALASIATNAAELVLAENGKSDYQIVIPDKAVDEVVDQWLLSTAKLMETAFRTNGFEVAVVRESARAPAKPGIYLGATAFAKKNGIKVEQHDDWTYYQKVVGKDFLIAGNDKKDPLKTPLALLGTVKGACDFLREHVGVRFLFLSNAPEPGGVAADGSLRLDTRSIAFLPVKRVVLPDPLDVCKTPLLKACSGRNYESFFHIANNFFPKLSHVVASTLHWGDAVSRAEQGAAHPEYFALMPDGKRSIEQMVSATQAGEEKHCVTQPGVIALMVDALSKRVAAGEKTIMIMPPDAYRLCYCNCDGCVRLFGRRAENWGDVQARGKSGKLWQAYFAIAQGLRKAHPEARLVLWDYQDTPIATVREFPENVIPQLQFGKLADFDRLQGVRAPAGFCGLEETFTGFGLGGRYMPERTPEYIAGIVQAIAEHNLQWTMRDGDLGQVRGLQAPAYYVYGRMLDDPSADWKDLQDEFCAAAFGGAAPTMRLFFDGLHEQIALYSDFFGVNGSAASRKYGRSTYRNNKWHLLSMYPPEYLAAAEGLLASAERQVRGSADMTARLKLIRIDFDYIRGLSRIYNLHDAWLFHPTQALLDPLLDAIEEWHAMVRSVADKPLEGWPEMQPFCGHGYRHASMEYATYQQSWHTTCLDWDTEVIREGIPDGERRLAVASLGEAPSLNSPAWEQAPGQVLRVYRDMPFRRIRTTFAVLRDQDALYVRVHSLLPAERPSSIPNAQTEEAVFKQEYIEIGLRAGAEGPVYRLAANPTTGMRYDAKWSGEKPDGMQEDREWNGNWEFAYQVPDTKESEWTAWFRIPFAELGAAAPATGETWGFNVNRVRKNPGMAPQSILWRNAPSVTDPQTLGTLVF